ncbi:aminoglycoside phosphotransferase family protein [Allokutzneria multivorans]|uniref:Aminoglycoside phosphotransferase family protein n=1 Tax=Allokutzneria multivorans TaxID=1142134 RepID=A0ABP7T4L2_9PSEU
MADREITIDGDRVLRPAAWWTPTVHALLEHLHAVGFDRVPRPLGIEAGCEIVTMLPGDAGRDAWAKATPERGLRAFAMFLRDYHEAVRGFVAPPGAEWALRTGGAGPGEVICHGDFGPWNVVWERSTPVGLIDFDMAGPGDPLNDVAHALEYSAPFRDDATAMRLQDFTEPPDRARRIEIFADAYGLTSTEGLVDKVIERQEAAAVKVVTLAERGLEPQRAWVEGGVLDELAQRVRWSRENLCLFGQ